MSSYFTDDFPEDLTVEEWVMIEWISSGYTYYEVAITMGISSKTIQRHARKPIFKKALADVRARRTEETMGRLSKLVRDANDVLAASLEDESPAIRLRAAEMVLKNYRNYKSDYDVDQRLTRLEEIHSVPAPIEPEDDPSDLR